MTVQCSLTKLSFVRFCLICQFTKTFLSFSSQSFITFDKNSKKHGKKKIVVKVCAAFYWHTQAISVDPQWHSQHIMQVFPWPGCKAWGSGKYSIRATYDCASDFCNACFGFHFLSIPHLRYSFAKWKNWHFSKFYLIPTCTIP
jgi:hypothetical protein